MYPEEHLDSDIDDGTMPSSRQELADAVVGHKIVKVEEAVVPGNYYGRSTATVITLDNGKQVELLSTDDCCAVTEVKSFLLHPDRVDHMIMGVGTTENYDRWHIYADLGDVLELNVNWSPGNPFYYGYGFEIRVRDVGSD